MTTVVASPDDFGIPRRNSRGYIDPTACKALTHVQRAEFGYQPLIYICSPYAGDIEANVSIARRFCRKAVDRRLIPIAPHLLFPQFMAEPDERDLAMFMNRVLLNKCEAIWIYTEQVTAGMRLEIEWAQAMDLPAVCFDHVAATYLNDQRSAVNFQSSDYVVMDVDNDHTDNPADWVDPAQLAEIMPEVSFMTATSRHHMTAKGATSPRPRFHVYFPITACCDAATYAGLKRRLVARLGFFDTNALDAGRFIYGTPNPQVTCHNGRVMLDE